VAAAQVREEARGHSLGLGDPAPKLDVKSFVKGEPIATLEPGKFYVVEFWATWCGPCRVSIPHLTKLQKKHPKVAFIGVSIWEQDQNAVKPFVDTMGDQMAYRVATDAIPEKGDANDGIMASKWMKAAGQGGIPTAFIIDKGRRIAWIGHPMSMDEPLEKIVNGSWDLRKEVDDRAVLDSIHKRAHELAPSKPSEAEPLFRQALEGYRKTLGPNEQLTIDLTVDLANFLSQSGRGAESETLFREVLERARKQFGPEDHRTLGILHRWAHALEASAPGEAEPLFREALHGYRKTEGHGAQALDLANDLASLLDRTGRSAEAEPLFRNALEGARLQSEPANPQTAGIMASWGLSLIHRGKWTEAEPVLRESLAIREKSQPDEWSTFNTRSLLGGSLLGQRKYDEAEPLIVSGYEGMKAREARIPPLGKPRLTEAAEWMVKLYEAWGKQDKAAEWRARLVRPSDVPKNRP
jgi:thiol-disulfide isomerase/thioredoxin/tetratricopeptide (TPR) repeat protein